jgi:hypothetical protein
LLLVQRGLDGGETREQLVQASDRRRTATRRQVDNRQPNAWVDRDALRERQLDLHDPTAVDRYEEEFVSKAPRRRIEGSSLSPGRCDGEPDIGADLLHVNGERMSGADVVPETERLTFIDGVQFVCGKHAHWCFAGVAAGEHKHERRQGRSRDSHAPSQDTRSPGA